MLEELAVNDRKNTARLTTAYDTLKMLYFKDFKEPSDEHTFTPEMSPSFEKMTEALAPPNFNYSSWDDGNWWGDTSENLSCALYQACKMLRKFFK